MNKIWFWMMFLGISLLLLFKPENIIPAMINASTNSFTLCLELAGVYALWMGILEILEKSGVSGLIQKLLSPLICILFPNTSEEARKAITVNITANFLGLGNAATPSGIDAMQKMDNGSGKATFGMILLLVVNATAIQLFPSTIVGIRASYGSTNPTDIFFPTLLSSTLSTIAGIFLCFAISKTIKIIKNLRK